MYRRRLLLKHSDSSGVRTFIYKYVTGDGARLRHYLLNSTFFLASPRKFNDPYDCRCHISDECTANEREVALQILAQKMRLNSLQLALLREQWDMPNLPQIVKEGTEQTWAETGITCLTTDPRNLLMWSHYADYHRGFCIGFEIAKDMDTFCTALPVKYTDDYPSVRLFGDDREIVNAMFHKGSPWAYENEYRIVRPGQAGNTLRFEPASLSMILIGAMAPIEAVEELNGVLKEREKLGMPAVRVLTAHLDAEAYGIRFHADTKNTGTPRMSAAL